MTIKETMKTLSVLLTQLPKGFQHTVSVHSRTEKHCLLERFPRISKKGGFAPGLVGKPILTTYTRIKHLTC